MIDPKIDPKTLPMNWHNPFDVDKIKKLEEKLDDLRVKFITPFAQCSIFHERAKSWRNIGCNAKVTAFRISYKFPDMYAIDKTPQVRSMAIRFADTNPISEIRSRAGRKGGRPRSSSPSAGALRARKCRENKKTRIT